MMEIKPRLFYQVVKILGRPQPLTCVVLNTYYLPILIETRLTPTTLILVLYVLHVIA